MPKRSLPSKRSQFSLRSMQMKWRSQMMLHGAGRSSSSPIMRRPARHMVAVYRHIQQPAPFFNLMGGRSDPRSKSGPPAGREIVKQLIKPAKRQSWQEPGQPRYLSILLYLSWKSSGGPERLRFVSKHHQTEEALDMCMALVSTLPRVFQKRKAAPTHPLEEKTTHMICREPSTSYQLIKAHTPKLRSGAQEKRLQDALWNMLQKLSWETSQLPLFPFLEWLHRARSTAAVTWPHHIHYIHLEAKIPIAWVLTTETELHMPRGLDQILQTRLADKPYITGVGKAQEQAKKTPTLKTTQKLKGGSKGFTIGHCYKKNPLTSSLSPTLPHRQGERKSENQVSRTNIWWVWYIHPGPGPKRQCYSHHSLDKKWRLQQIKSTGTVRTPITRWYYKARSTQITIQLVINHSRKLLIWPSKNPCFAVVETKVKSYPPPPRWACARPCTWMLGHPTPLPAFISSAHSAQSHKCSTSVHSWTISDLFWSFIKDD